VTPERRVSPWWMLLPALLFVLNFIGGLTEDTGDRANAVYDLSTLVASGAIEAALAGYAVLATRLSAQPIAETLAIRRVPLRAALVTGAIGLVVILASEAVLDPIFNGGAQQGIEPSHSPQTTHEWVAVGVAVLMLVLVAPVAEELIFRGLGFAALGPVAVPVTSLLFAIAHGLPSLLVEVAVAGLVLAEIRRRTDSVLPGMGVHMAFNGLALVVAFLTM
jgi:membrane protease YdiL (CAAX protease family)